MSFRLASAKTDFDSRVNDLGHDPHYKSVESDYYIISDYNEDGKNFYEKCVYKEETEYCEKCIEIWYYKLCAKLVYPESYKKFIDPIIEKIGAFDTTK